LHAAEGFFIAEAARKEDSAFEMIAGDAVLDDLDFVRITRAANQFESPSGMAGGDAGEGFGQERLGLAAANGPDAKDDGIAVGETWGRSVGREKGMIALKDFGFVVRELLDEPILIVF